jgi:hypothetical protein
MEIKIEREQLYRDVWSQSLTKLAPKYHLSDNGLRKVCKALNVPLPQQGHWAKVAAGHTISPRPLPKECAQNVFVSHPPVREEGFSEPDDAAWLAERCAFEVEPDNKILANLKWHPAITPFLEPLLAMAAEMERAKKDFERAEVNPRLRTHSTYTGGRWPYFSRDGQMLSYTHKSRPARVTLPNYERALGLLNTLCVEGE